MKRKKLFYISAITAIVICAVVGGLLYRRKKILKKPAAPAPKVAPATTDFNSIRALPYLGAGSRPAAGSVKGVVDYDPEKAFNGINLYTSCHRDEAYLIDMNGRLLHKWNYSRDKIWPDRKSKKKRGRMGGIRFAYAFENLDLLAIYDYLGLIKLDKNSQEIWRYRGEPHHDLWITPENNIYLLTSKEELLPRLNKDTILLLDYITVLNSSGKEKASYSILEMLEQSQFSFLLPTVNQIDESEPLDLLHANSIEVFDGSLSNKSERLFKKGNLLISLRNLSFVFIFDPDSGEIVWGWGPTNISYQHKARLVDNGHILIFNNGLKASSVIEIDPLSRKLVWEYKGDSENRYFSELLGSSQRLTNGNTLIIESNTGTVFEVTPDKDIVWKFINPAEKDGKIAVIPEMYRYERNFFEGLF